MSTDGYGESGSEDFSLLGYHTVQFSATVLPALHRATVSTILHSITSQKTEFFQLRAQ